MNTLNDIIAKAVASPATIDADDIAELRRIARDCPASALAPAMLLRFASAQLSDAERDAFRARVAITGGCTRSVINFIDPSGRGFDAFYPPAPLEQRPSTTSAIDIFLETYGHQSPEEDALLERMIFNPVPDYAEQLAREAKVEQAKVEQAKVEQAKVEQASRPATHNAEHGQRTHNAERTAAAAQDALIDAFLDKNPAHSTPEPNPPITPNPPTPPKSPKKSPEAPPQGTLLSESLAKIFIKQGRYDRAYEIITNLSLNYPKKSVYFADQLRFLEKLMINQRHAKPE